MKSIAKFLSGKITAPVTMLLALFFAAMAFGPLAAAEGGGAQPGVGLPSNNETVLVDEALAKLPEGPYHADVPEYYLPPKEDVYHNMESLIYHFKIVMGEVPVPVAEIYHPVEGGNGEIGFYLVTDGSRTPYRLHFRRPCFIYYQAYPEMIKGAMLSDAIVILSSLNVIAGELDA